MLENQLRGAEEAVSYLEVASSRDMSTIISSLAERAEKRVQELLEELK